MIHRNAGLRASARRPIAAVSAWLCTGLVVAGTVGVASAAASSSGVISRFAGTGTSGAPTLGPATSSQLGTPYAVAVDSLGNVYSTDAGNHEVDKITPAGMLSVIAGNGISGSPTPGLATTSKLAAPEGMAVDAAGDVFVCDPDNHVVEKVTSAGVLSIVAGNAQSAPPTYGGSATASSLLHPYGVAATPAGRLYIADTWNHTIDQVIGPLPVSTTAPAISGTTTNGQTLSATTGTWTQSPEIYTYQWQNCDSTGAACTSIVGAASSRYTLKVGDIGDTVRVIVKAENSGGSAATSSAVSAVIAAVPTTPITIPPVITPAPPITILPAGVNTTTAATQLKGQSARLGGVVAAHSSAVSYRFQYGARSGYHTLSAARALLASASEQAVATPVVRLVPGTTYHYRLMVINSAGTTSYGTAKTLTTPRVAPQRVRDHISARQDRHAAHHYRVNGRLVLVRGLSKRIGCRTRGAATVTVTRGTQVIAHRRVTVTQGCTYTATFSFTKAQLPASGHISFRMRFAGNRQLRSRDARTLRVLYRADLAAN